MSVLDAATVDLPPTATYPRREAQWVPADEPGEGYLTLRLWKGRRAGSKCERDVYEVMEEDAVGTMGRSFLLLNKTDADQPDAYRCVVGPVDMCTCKAGLVNHYRCKHKDGLRTLISEGLL